MVFAIVFFFNAGANFVLGIILSALLGPAEFGRFATVLLGATTLATALFDWLRLASIRFSGAFERRERTAASLDAGYIAAIVLALAGGALCVALGQDFGLGPVLIALTPALAIAVARGDYAAATMRARDSARAFAMFALLRQALTFTVVIGAAVLERSAAAVAATLALAILVPAVALGGAMRTPGARLNQASPAAIAQFAAYAAPIVVSTVLYLTIGLINRHVALDRLGAAATGKLALATDLGFRLFLVINVLPETLLFQYALQRDRDEGRAVAERQLRQNISLVFAVLAPLAVGYMAMVPTFEALVVPVDYRGDYARLSLELTPGFLAFCALYSMCNPIFQLEKRTWPLTLAALAAIAADIALVALTPLGADLDGLARAHAASFVVGFAVAAALAWRSSRVRPNWRDLGAIGAASLVLAVALPPLNGLHPPLLAALLALCIGGATLGAAIVGFNVAGLRQAAIERIRPLGRGVAAARPQW